MKVSEFLALPEEEQILLIGTRCMGWTPGSGHFHGWNPMRERPIAVWIDALMAVGALV